MSDTLTAMQEKVFQFIVDFLESNGFPPSYSDIATHFDFSSDGTVRTYLEHLERKKYIKRMGRARGIQILKSTAPSAIPIIGSIAAGPVKLAVEEFNGTLADIRELEKEDGRFALRIQGDSMKDAGILDGDLAIIQTQVPVNNGQIGAVLIDDEATLKRVYYEKDRVRLQPENEFYDPIYVDRSSFNSRVIGRYIALVRKA